MVPVPNWRDVPKKRTSRPASGYGSGWSKRPRTMLKTLVVAPMARPSVRTTMTPNPGLRVSIRNAPRRSCRRPLMERGAARSVPRRLRGGGLTERPEMGKRGPGTGRLPSGLRLQSLFQAAPRRAPPDQFVQEQFAIRLCTDAAATNRPHARRSNEAPTRMRSILSTVSCVAALGLACSRHPAQQQAAAGPPTVTVAPVTQRDVPIYGEFVGQTAAANTVEIRSQVSGFLQQIAFTEGAVVQKGALLFRIDPRSYEAALQQSRAALAQRQAALGKARQDVNRYRPLVEKHAISGEQLDAALAQEAQERANVEAARAQMQQAELNVSYTRISAPLTGRIGAAQVKIGALVQAGSTLLDTMYSVEPMYVGFSVSEQRHLEYQKRIREHPATPPPLQLILSDGSTYPQPGRINLVSPQVNPATGTIAIRGEFPNPDRLLRPGLFVRVRVLIEERKNAMLVPQQAVQETQGVKSLLVVGDDNKVAMRTVEVSSTADNFAVIDSGVKAGERVIVEGAQKVRPGIQVAVQQGARAETQDSVAPRQTPQPAAPPQAQQPTSGRAPPPSQR